jgi:hypothetical protein
LRAWGREHTAIHTLDKDDVIAIEFKAGGALVEGGRNHERKGDGRT